MNILMQLLAVFVGSCFLVVSLGDLGLHTWFPLGSHFDMDPNVSAIVQVHGRSKASARITSSGSRELDIGCDVATEVFEDGDVDLSMRLKTCPR